MTAPPSRTATPESLLVVVHPTCQCQPYVASSFISERQSLFNTVIESVPTAHISPARFR